MAKPVILLAFANERQKEGVYLPTLAYELNQLKDILETLEDKGICEVEILPSATLDNLVAAFQKEKFKDRIAIFHYSGHADDYELLLESATGNTTVATHGEGLVPFLANQKSLKFIFLNGCFSARQAEDLVKNGIPAVIGTLQAIKDQVAADLSISFYKALAQGAGLEQAWKEATYKVQAQKGTTDLSGYYSTPDDNESDQTRDLLMRPTDDRFPWEIYFREGADKIKYWNLPDAANDPYFGLPELPPHYELPDQPYRFLERYTPKDARVFFGRGTYIRDLYQRLVSEQSAPIIMLYGQSGVGKSSLLGAGVFPRLEKDYEIQFIRRDPKKGLLGALKTALMPDFEAGPEDQATVYGQLDSTIADFEEKIKSLDGAARYQLEKVLADLKKRRLEFEQQPDELSGNLGERWKQLEQASGKKGLLIILDQVEEIYTRPQQNDKEELDHFLKEVQQIFDQFGSRPKGKLVLAYRKEYDSELEKAFRQYNLPKEKVFLDKLDRGGIVEIVQGLTSNQNLRNKYKLEIEEGLPGLMADNLLLDKDSSIAPVLQIVLTKLWQQQEPNDKRRFLIEDYQKLQEAGILLGDFFKHQMEQIKAWEARIHQKVESSGLALDILNYHTTALGTAESRSLEDLRKQYNHQSNILEDLIQEFKKLYLLTDIGTDRTGLAHDTLAPIVQKEIKDSDKPGQRALRIIQTKVIDYERNPDEVVIEEDDLTLVEEGADGMRIWMPKEKELVEKSQAYRADQERIRQLNRRIKTGLSIAVAIFAVIATLFWYRNWKEARINELMAKAQDNNPTIGLQLAKKVFELAPNRHNSIQLLNKIYSENFFYKNNFVQQKGINAIALSPDGKTIVTGGKDNYARIWSVNGDFKGILEGHEEEILTVAFSPDGQTIATASHDNTIKLWNLEGELQQSYPTQTMVNDLRFSEDNARLLYASSDNTVKMRWLQMDSLTTIGRHGDQVMTADIFQDRIISGDRSGIIKVWTIGKEAPDTTLSLHNDRILKLRFSPNGQRFASASRDATLILWDTTFKDLARFRGHKVRVNDLAFGKNGEFLLSVSDDKTAILWDTIGNTLKTFVAHSDYVTGVSLLPGGKSFITCSMDGTIKTWPIEIKEVLKTGPFKDRLRSVSISSDGQQILTGVYAYTSMEAFINKSSYDPNNSRNAYLFSANGDTLKVLQGHKKGISDVSISPDNQYALTGSNDGTAILWKLDSPEKILAPFKVLDKHQANKEVKCVAFSPDGQHLVTGTTDGAIILWNSAGDSLFTFKEHRNPITSVTFSPDGKEILSGSLEGIAYRWSLEGEVLQSFRTIPHRISQVDYSPDGTTVAASTWGGYTMIWDKNGRFLLKIWSQSKNQTGHPAIHAVAFSPDGKLIATSEGENEIHLRDLKGNSLQIIAENDDEIKDLAFSPDGKYLYAASDDKSLTAYYTLPEFLKQEEIAPLNPLQQQLFGLKKPNFSSLLMEDSLELLRTYAYHFEKTAELTASTKQALDPWEKATQLYTKILEFSNSSGDTQEAKAAFCGYGKALLSEGQYRASIQQFEKLDAYKQSDNSFKVAYCLALYFDKKEEKAKATLEAFQSDESEYENIMTWLFTLLSELYDREEADAILDYFFS